MSPSVTHVCAPAAIGGLERVVQGLAQGGRARGDRVSVIAVVEPEADVEPFLDLLADVGVPARVLRLGGRDYLGEIRSVRRILSGEQPDVVHTHGYRPDILHGLTARRLGSASVSTVHSVTARDGVARWIPWLQTRALRAFDAVVAVSDEIARTLEAAGVPPSRVHRLPNAIPPVSRPLGRPEARDRLEVEADHQVVLGWIGRLEPVKGCDVFVRALAVLDVDTPWSARIVGDGPERGSLEREAEELGLGDRVGFLGAVPEARRLLEGVDAFVLSSRSEGTPMALLEAMAAGVPVVVTRVGGVPAVVDGGVEGWVVPPEDPDAMAAALAEVVGDAGLRARRGEAARRRIETRFSFDRWIEGQAAVYDAARTVRAGRSRGADLSARSSPGS